MFLKVDISTLDQLLFEIEPQREIGDVQSYVDNLDKYQPGDRERNGSVVECLTGDRRAAGSSLTGVTALWSFSKTH